MFCWRLILSALALGTIASAQQFRIAGQAALAEPLAGAFKVVTADVNGDGRPDLLAGGASGIIVLINPGSGSWPPGRRIPVPDKCARQNIAAADFDGDGVLDLAVFCFDAGTLATYRGDGQGGFELRTQAPMKAKDGNAHGLLAADVNQDGFVDLVVAQPGNLSVFAGQGDGTFVLAGELAIGGSPQSPATPAAIVAADFNGDGIPDLAAVNLVYDDELSVFLGTGGGKFAGEVKVTLGCRPLDLTAVDFNQDGKPDLAVACGSLVLLAGRGDGSFGPGPQFQTGQSAISVAAGDLDGDGRPDFAVGNYYGGEISIVINGQDGALHKVDAVASIGDVFGVALADFDGDGIPDLAASSFSGASALIATGAGGGTFGRPTYFGTNSAGTFALALADSGPGAAAGIVMVAEGRKSVYLASPATGVIQVIAGDDYPIDARLADVTGDGIPDLVLATTSRLTGRRQYDFGAAIQVLPGRPDGNFDPEIRAEAGQCRSTPEPPPPGYTGPSSCDSFTSAMGMLRLQTGDFTGDALADIALLNGTANQLHVYARKADGTFESAGLVGNQMMSPILAAGFTGDGRTGIAATFLDGHTVVVYARTERGLEENGRYRVCGDQGTIGALRTGDFNGDGKPDLAVLCWAEVDILLNTGVSGKLASTPVVTQRRSDTVFSNAAVADFNGDGKPDLIVPSETGLALYPGNGDGTFGGPSIIATGITPLSLLAADFDGDGVPDVAVMDIDGNLKILTTAPGSAPAFRLAPPRPRR